MQSSNFRDTNKPRHDTRPPSHQDRQLADGLQPSLTDDHQQKQQQRQRQQQQQQRQHRRAQQPKLHPLIISGNTTNSAGAADLARDPHPIADLPAAGLRSSLKKEDRPGKGEVSAAAVATGGAALAVPEPLVITKSRTAQTQTQPNKTLDHKVVTFLQPAPSSLDDRSSLCQSPSWEAYGRRKKEKKEKEQADREAKSRKRRLTKVPPPSPTPAAAAANSPDNPPVSTTPNEAAPSESTVVQAQTLSCMRESRTRHSQPQTAADQSANASMAAYTNSDLPLDIPVPHTPRGRSGSFSSLFKAPFEFRRSSIDHEREERTGFIGGIKLEQHRTAAYQKALEDSIIGPEGQIHPAFRRERRSSSPLRFLTPRHTPRASEDRHYPPIAIKTTGNEALIAPESPKHPDGGMMKKWRERVGLRASSKDGESDTETKKRTRTRRLSKSSPQTDRSAARPTHSKDESPLPAIKPEPVVSSEVAQESDKAPATYVDNRLNLTLPAISPLSSSSIIQDAVSGTEHKIAQPSPLSLEEDTAQSYFDAPEEAAPPPPRKSSKRKSLISLSDANILEHGPLNLNPLGIELPPPIITTDAGDTRRSSTSLSEARAQKQPADKKPPNKLNKVNRQSSADPPSVPYESLTSGRSPARDSSLPPKRTLRDAARAAFGRPASSATDYVIPASSSSRPGSRAKSPYHQGPAADLTQGPSSTTKMALTQDSTKLSKPARVLGEVDWRTGYPSSTSASPPTNSSEDSGSDDGQIPDTPDTSRPQSERGGSFGDDAKRGRLSTTASALPSPALPSPATEPGRSTDKPTTVELDNIQAAAMKVMAAFPEPLPKRIGGGDWRSSSDTNLTTSFLPKTKPRQSFQSQSSRDRSRPLPINTNMAPSKDPESKSPPLRDLLLSKDESAATAPWPATYLEAARKAAPAAPAPKTLKQQASSSTPNLAPPRRIGGPSNRSSRQSSPHQRAGSRAASVSASATADGEPIAKMFVECCSCKYYHDMPSKLYEAMAHPEDVLSLETDYAEFAGSVSMTVKCPWCKHDMSTKCCAGLAAMVYVKERLH